MKFDEFKQSAIAALVDCPKKASEIAQATGANSASVYNWLKKLAIAGDIVKGHDGVYRLSTNEELSEAFIETAIAESESVEVEVIEMRMPRASMTTSKPKLATVTAITPAKPAIAPYLQEQQAENHWAFVLRHANVSDGMETQASVNRLANASNWNVFAEGLDLCSAGLMAVQQIAGNYQAYLENKAKKGASAISLHDVQVFVADKIWEAKLTNDAILNPALKLQAQFWQTDRTYRARLHEALIKSGKWFLTEVNALMSLTGGGLSKDQLDTYLKQYGDRQQAFLDELLNSRQAQAKRIVAEEIGNAVNIDQLPEAK